jgi:hypothetical protein
VFGLKKRSSVQLRTAHCRQISYFAPVPTVILTQAELTALAAVDGTPTQPEMSPEIRQRLHNLGLIERRTWPNGPLWRTTFGTRHVKRE